MSEANKSYRVKANVGADSFIKVSLEQEFDALDILSLSIKSEDVYRLHNSNYGVIVGRVIANDGFGVPNAKISIFIEHDNSDDDYISTIYPYTTPASYDESGYRYNLYPDEKVSNCHQAVGSFPNKRYLLDNEDIIEVFDKYYKYTTRTNGAGDYMICGVPTGAQTLHMDLDLSDCGILSQRPRDFIYKGYTVEQFESPNMFKKGKNYANLSQLFTQDQTVYVQPFWGNESLGETIGITRADINIAYKFEPTCVFMGSVISDNSSQGISKKCIPTNNMGNMDELVTGKGTIEMIRKTYGGSVEEFQVKGTELINGDGIWCYQIPMNLDYMITDEYGNMVPTDNPDKGIPTRTRVRFRVSMQDFEQNTDNFFRPKVLVPHNPQNISGFEHEDYDYEFGSYTGEESFRDLFWNGVYTVKSYIPRFQKRKVGGWKTEQFTGIKHCQNYGRNNPIPYNNIRIRLPFMFKIVCILTKAFIKITKVINTIISMIGNGLAELGHIGIRALNWYPFGSLYDEALKLKMNVIDEGLCPDLENWYFSPVYGNPQWSPKKVPSGHKRYNLLKQTLESITLDDDPQSIDDQNQDDEDTAKCLTTNTDYLISCMELNLAQEYKVINFDFYNDWVNGTIYIPRFARYIRRKRKFLGITIVKAKVRGCMDDKSIFSKTRRYTQMCSIGYKKHQGLGKYEVFSKTEANLKNIIQIIKSNNLHKKRGLTQEKIFGKKNAGICHEKETMYGQHVYYLKPCEWTQKGAPANRKINLFATDIVLLGSLNDCDLYGIPQAFKHLVSSSYVMPTNLALTNMEENGPLYAYGDRGTICSKVNETDAENGFEKVYDPVKPIEGSSTPLTDELKFYSGSSSNYDTQYDDPSDTIAMTEAAGIAWNYSGPGQGKINKRKMYYPGGHFLGLSCVNSQSNIKSCINLERICELGTAMSQRKEDVRAVIADETTNETKLEYVYSVPTGFISGDDIIDDEFRVMFATMNQNRLLARKINPKTGYRVYDFAYVDPINFGGDFMKYTGNGTPYNTKNTGVRDESSLLEFFGIVPATEREDYDPNEAIHTQRRTIEFPSVDYYMFRMGLTYDDLKPNNPRHMRQFAKDENGRKYLPQYENSFYFYFGTKDGATALDEFNKQFFSVCDDTSLLERETSIYLLISDYDFCTGKSTVLPHIKNMEGYMIYTIESLTPGGINPIHGKWDDENSIIPIKLPQGKYHIKVTDEEGEELETNFSIGGNVISTNFTAYDFNVTMQGDILPRHAGNMDMYYGGYLKSENLTINAPKPEMVTNIKITAVKEGFSPKLMGERISIPRNADGMEHNLYLTTANTNYDVYVSFRYTDCEESEEVYIYVTTINLLNSNSVDLTIGPVETISYKDIFPTYGVQPFDEGWWRCADNLAIESPISWNIRKSVVKPSPSPEETFSNSVVPINGTKVLFGTPQNLSYLYPTDHILSTEYDIQIPEEFTLDDDVSSHPIYGCMNYYTAYQYNSMAIKGVTVSGDFAGKVNGTGLTKSVNIIGGGLRNGEGCLFKPLPNGDIYPAIYVQGAGIVCIVNPDDFDTKSEIYEYDKGIVYPTITYPVIDKPMLVNANYFLTKRKELVETTDADGNVSADVSIVDRVGKCESHIFNGLTYRSGGIRYFGGDSYMPMVTNPETDEGMEDTFRVEPGNPENPSDLYGIFPDYHEDNKAYFSGYTVEPIEDLSYSIQEGAPFYSNGGAYSANKKDGFSDYDLTSKYKTVAETAELFIDYTFYDDVYFSIEGSDMYFEFKGKSDSDIEYYAIPLTALNNVIIENTEETGYTWINPANRTFFILGRYTDKATYDTEGADVVVKVFDPESYWYNMATWFKAPRLSIPFTHVSTTSDGEEKYVVEDEVKMMNWREVGITPAKDEIGKFVDEAVRLYNGRVAFDKERLVLLESLFRYETDMASWTNTVSGAIMTYSNSKIQLGGKATPSPVGTSKYPKIVVVGLKPIDTGGTATSNVFTVYMNPIMKSEMLKATNVLSVEIAGQRVELVVSNDGGTFEGSATVSNVTGVGNLTSDLSSTWCNYGRAISRTSTDDAFQYYSFTIVVPENDSNEERQVDITFSVTIDEREYMHTIKVRQTRSTKEIEENVDELNSNVESINGDISNIREDISDINDTINNQGGGGETPTTP